LNIGAVENAGSAGCRGCCSCTCTNTFYINIKHSACFNGPADLALIAGAETGCNPVQHRVSGGSTDSDGRSLGELAPKVETESGAKSASSKAATPATTSVASNSERMGRSWNPLAERIGMYLVLHSCIYIHFHIEDLASVSAVDVGLAHLGQADLPLARS